MPRKLKDLESRNAILDCVISFKRANDGNSPTFGEISELTGYSKSTVSHHLKMLSRFGYLRYDNRQRIIVQGGEWVYP